MDAVESGHRGMSLLQFCQRRGLLYRFETRRRSLVTLHLIDASRFGRRYGSISACSFCLLCVIRLCSSKDCSRIALCCFCLARP